jgi:hypothetical protein
MYEILQQIGITFIVSGIAITIYNIVSNIIKDKVSPFEIEKSIINGVHAVDLKFRKKTALSVSGDIDVIINGDVFFINNGKLCLLSKDSIHIDAKKLYLQSRDESNPLMKRHKSIKEELERNDQILIELEKQKEK